MASDEPSGKSAILSATDDERWRILQEYFQTTSSGVTYFTCPEALRPPCADAFDETLWFIYALDGKTGYVVDYPLIDWITGYEKYAFVANIMTGLTFVVLLTLSLPYAGSLGSIGSAIALSLVMLLVWAFWSFLFYLPVMLRLRGKRRVTFDDDLVAAVSRIEQAKERRAGLVSAAGKLVGLAAGLAVGNAGQKLVEELTSKAVEMAAQGHVNRHGERLASERPPRETNPGRPGDTAKD